MENQTAYYPSVQPEGMVQTKPQIDIAARKKGTRKFCFISLGFYAAAILLILTGLVSRYLLQDTIMHDIARIGM